MEALFDAVGRETVLEWMTESEENAYPLEYGYYFYRSTTMSGKDKWAWTAMFDMYKGEQFYAKHAMFNTKPQGLRHIPQLSFKAGPPMTSEGTIPSSLRSAQGFSINQGWQGVLFIFSTPTKKSKKKPPIEEARTRTFSVRVGIFLTDDSGDLGERLLIIRG